GPQLDPKRAAARRRFAASSTCIRRNSRSRDARLVSRVSAMERKRLDVDPETELAPDPEENGSEAEIQLAPDTFPEEEPGAEAVATGVAAIQRYAKLAPSTPGVYRMLNARSEVLYVGKAKNIAKRVAAYTRDAGHEARIARMIAATASMEFVS